MKVTSRFERHQPPSQSKVLVRLEPHLWPNSLTQHSLLYTGVLDEMEQDTMFKQYSLFDTFSMRGSCPQFLAIVQDTRLHRST